MFNFTSPKKKAYSEMLQNAQPFLDKYKRITGYDKIEKHKEKYLLEYKKNKHGFKTFDEYWDWLTNRIFVDDESLKSWVISSWNPKNLFLFCYSPENKKLKDQVRQVHNQKKIYNLPNIYSFERSEDKLYWFEIEYCFKEKYYPNLVTDMFDQDLKRSWLFKQRIYGAFEFIFEILKLIIFLCLISSPIWILILIWRDRL